MNPPLVDNFHEFSPFTKSSNSAGESQLKRLLFLMAVMQCTLAGCDKSESQATRECTVVSHEKADIEGFNHTLLMKLKRCDDSQNTLEISLYNRIRKTGRVLIKQSLTDIDNSSSISGLGIRVEKTEFREYTVFLPDYVDVHAFLQLTERNGRHCLDGKDFAICFSQ